MDERPQTAHRRRSEDPLDRTQSKRNAALEAAGLIREGMNVGLGTGSTAELVLEQLAARLARCLRIRGVPTSEATAAKARAAGIPLVTLDDVESLDLTVDGADEITAEGSAIKGGGGALLREKAVTAATRGTRVAAVDESKLVQRLGAFPLPVEVIPFARPAVERLLTRLGGAPVWRKKAGAPALTDNGNHLVDCHFAPRDDWSDVVARLEAAPGVCAHGLFLDCFDVIVIGSESGVSLRQVERKGAGRFPSF